MRLLFFSIVLCLCILSCLYGFERIQQREHQRKKAVDTETGVGFTKPKDELTPWIETVSWQPRAFVFHNFITKEEGQQIIDFGKDSVSKSLVVGADGTNVPSKGRTSNGVFLGGNFMTKYPLLRHLEKRIADWTQLPVENGEAFYLLRYEQGQQYKAHNDWFPKEKMKNEKHGNRMATVIIYLQSPDEGGDTVFPNTGARVNAKAGDALLFFDLDPAGEGDANSLHAGEPVLKGVKWAMTKWIRQGKFWYWYDSLAKDEQQQIDVEDTEYLKTRRQKAIVN